MWLKYIIAWLPLPALAVINGFIRNYIYLDSVGELHAHQISTVILLLIISAYVIFINSKLKINSSKTSLAMGLIWLLLTVGFEFGFGHYVFGNSWEKLLADYDLSKGRLWPFILLWTFFSPYVIWKYKKMLKTKN